MMNPRRIATSLFVAVALAAIPQVALAATTYNDTIVGREFFATTTVGGFAGTATGDLPGSWLAIVEHTPLSTTATITGGDFALATEFSGQPATIIGTFSGGTVTQTGGLTGCQNQTYAVHGTLENVGPNGDGTGTGTFDAVLTHLRTTFLGRCVTYGARVTGTVSLTF
jgi:hypothetical protein